MSRLELGPEGSPHIIAEINGSNNLEVRDSDGNVIATLKQDQSSEFQSVTINQLDITGEVLVEVQKTSDQAYATANGFVTVTWDSEVVDVTDNFDLANNNFSPPESGSYLVICFVTVDSFSDQDSLALKIQNTTDGSRTFRSDTGASGTDTETVVLAKEVNLDSSKTYEAQFRNNNSDDNIDGTTDRTYMTISRSEEN